MRKQTKLVAVLSTAALLAIGASMTSFAATGWVEEDGTWVYYNRDEERATEEWKKSGDNWFWLDDNGEMAVDQLVEDDDDYYYVNEAGAMVSNQWVAIENEDAGEDDEPDVYWYYFQANGKAYKRSENASPDSISAKTINGKKYAFDTEGRMLYGWVKEGERQTDDEDWKESLYYFGDENDGAMSIGWRQISVIDEDSADEQQPGDEFWDEEQDRWFYFQTSGKKVVADGGTADDLKTKTINGQKYGFDGYGRMIGNWFVEGTVAEADDGKVWVDDKGVEHIATQGNADYSRSFMYFSDPEDGARVTKGWFKVVPGYYLHESKYEDGDDYWYYADGSGNLYANEIKSIKGKKYAFDNYGRMIDGLALIRMASKNEEETKFDSSEIVKKYDNDAGVGYDYDTEDNFDDTVAKLSAELTKGQYRFFYFGGEDDGAMKTGKQTVEIDGDDFTFKFKDSTSSKGAAIHGEDDDKLYAGGKLLKADKDDKYQVVLYVESTDNNDEVIYMNMLDVEDFIDDYCEESVWTDNGDVTNDEEKADAETYFVKGAGELVDAINDALAEDEVAFTVEATEDGKDFSNAEVTLYLVNSSGSTVKKKSAAKDGSDYKFDVADYNVKSVSYDID